MKKRSIAIRGSMLKNPTHPGMFARVGSSSESTSSLTLALLTLFVISFALHAWGGAREYSQEQLAHGGEAVSTLEFLTTSQFWFESFQNWQSEFLAVASLAWLSVFLRQRGSPESKPVAAPHFETGS